MGTVAPRAGYLEALREITRRAAAVLIFDEVMTGFRLALGGAQQLYGVRPDMTCLGKIMGGGLPARPTAGGPTSWPRSRRTGRSTRRDALGQSARDGGRARRFSSCSRSRALRHARGAQRAARGGADARGAGRGDDGAVNRVGSMITVFFCAGPVTDYTSAKQSDTKRFARFFHAMLARGVYLPPAQFEAAFVSLAHGEREIDETLAAATAAFRDAA
jgi:glutamate-1-semialdehyde 2,1-aminomutase